MGVEKGDAGVIMEWLVFQMEVEDMLMSRAVGY